ncbi:MAG: hypothetical protein NZZ41_02560 [Candidatus Dojkabacteria bacterium]|nr:hypothetical protein [Candidatus Dojkabacteria bacterium]
MIKQVKVVTINPSTEAGMGKVKIFMPARIDAIVSTINPNIVSLHLSCEVYSLYQGKADRENFGWTLQKEYMKSIGIPEEYHNWNIYEPEIRRATENISRFILNRLGLKEGDYINGTYIDKIKLPYKCFENHPQVLVFSTEQGKFRVVNETGFHVSDTESLKEILDKEFTYEWIFLEEAYYPRYVLNKSSSIAIDGLIDDDVKKAHRSEEVWIEV